LERLDRRPHAGYFRSYPLSRENVEYILGTFQGIANEDKKAEGEGRHAADDFGGV
jgi:hypothetical protein